MLCLDDQLLNDWFLENKRFFTERDWRYLIKNYCFPATVGLSCLEQVKKDYLSGKPLAYILGKEEFYGREFKINQNVLVPRPETELIVEKAVLLAQQAKPGNILDLCCGSGVIAISLAKELTSQPQICLSDISLAALDLAKENAARYELDLEFVRSDLFARFLPRSWDLIVTNPPYVKSSQIVGQLINEPRLALDGGKNGLELIKAILAQAPNYLRPQGNLIVEFGFDQKTAVKELVNKLKSYDIIDWIKDYQQFTRGVILKVR